MKGIHPLENPVISQQFGENPAIYQRFGLPGHNGVDYSCKENTPILCFTDGCVVKVEKHPSYGNIIKIKHSNGYFSLYAHLNESKVLVDAQVKCGDIIALSGNTGFSTGPHLHFGLQSSKEGKKEYLYYINPLPFIS